MTLPIVISTRERDLSLDHLGLPLRPQDLSPGGSHWEVELGFGKGRYLLHRAVESPEARFLGVEVVSKYFRLLRQRGRRRGLENLVTIRGEALYLLSTVLPQGFASVVHVYFPDPWPKSRHHKRRLFDPETVDLVLGLLRPGGRLLFATDFLEYGERVRELLEGFPGLAVNIRPEVWDEGPRTNYEAKYVEEGRPILRLECRLEENPPSQEAELHPGGEAGIVCAWGRREEESA